jgi:hypothetical protein
MSRTDQFWQYAKEAILSACYAETDEERQGLLHLERTWTQAALMARASSIGSPESRRCHTANCWNLMRWPMVGLTIKG